jgi:cytochrome b561
VACSRRCTPTRERWRAVIRNPLRHEEQAVNTATAQTGAAASKPRHSNPFGNLSAVRRLVAPAVTRPFAVVETVVFMLVVFGLCWTFDRADPLLLKSGFPWLWFAPFVIGLRYGTLLGLLASAMVVAAWYLLGGSHGEAWPLMFFIGGFLQTVVAGHFGDTWGHRAARASTINDYLNDRLVAITNSHYLMRLSHERLEKDLLSRPTTLRDSITELRRLSVLGESAGEDSDETQGTPMRHLPGAHGLLEFVAQVCQIEVAALFPVLNGQVSTQAAARVGDDFALAPDDELVTHAVSTMSVAHLKSEDIPVAQSQYLVCAPLVSADGQLLAMLVIKRMPFLSLNFDNLQLLLVLLGYYADGVEHADLVAGILAVVPGCPYEFALDLGRLTRLQRDAGIASSMVALAFPRDEAGDSLFEHVIRRRRALDLMWPVQTASQSVLVNLMPATDTTGIDGYLARIETSLSAQFNLDLESARVGVHTLHLGAMDPGPALQRLLKRSGLDV